LWKGRKPNISYIKPFGCECYILNTKEQIGKFDSKADKGIFLGYSDTSRGYRVYNSRTLVVEESIHVRFNDGLTTDRKLSKPDDDLVDLQSNKEISFDNPKEELKTSHALQPSEPSSSQIYQPSDELSDKKDEQNPKNNQPRDWKFKTHHAPNLIIGDKGEGVRTRSRFKDQANIALISEVEPKTIDEALKDDGWIVAMQEELNQFTRNEVWTLVP